MLILVTMVSGLATEMWSRPAQRDADGYRGWVGDPVRSERIMMLERKRRSYTRRNYQLRPERPASYPYQQTLDGLPSWERQKYYEQDVPPAPPPVTFQERMELRDYARAYTRNYCYRCDRCTDAPMGALHPPPSPSSPKLTVCRRAG